MRHLSWVLVVSLSGCALATHPGDVPDQPERTVDGGALSDGPSLPYSDLATPSGPVDLAISNSSDLAMSSTSVDLASAVDLAMPVVNACVPRVNEIMTGEPSAATNEFVEVYNPCANAIDLSGWKLVYRASTNTAPVSGSDSSTLFSFASGTQIAASHFLVYGGSSFTGTADGALAASLKDGAGAVGLRDSTGTLVDSVGYGTVDTTNAFVRSSAAPAPPVVAGGGSIGRMPDGSDTGNNSADFHVSSKITPGAANQ